MPIHLEDLKLAQQFVEHLRTAKLEDSGLSKETLQRLRDPPGNRPSLDDDPDMQLSIKLFLKATQASERMYTEVAQIVSERFPEYRPVSHARVETILKNITGVTSIKHDMCPKKSCVAFTGPLRDAEVCPICAASRWDDIKLKKKSGKKVAAKTFCTIPLGPQLQALFSSPESAKEMQYRQKQTQRIVASATGQRIQVPLYDDYI